MIHRFQDQEGQSRPRLRFVDVKAQLRDVGMTISRDAAGEYRVTFFHKQDEWTSRWSRSAHSSPRVSTEDVAYYTSDLDDALATGIAMAKRGYRS